MDLALGNYSFKFGEKKANTAEIRRKKKFSLQIRENTLSCCAENLRSANVVTAKNDLQKDNKKIDSTSLLHFRCDEKKQFEKKPLNAS